jgi:hypothetical protein
MLAAIIEHAALGGVFATTGACLRGRCQHLSHRIIFGGALVVIESIVMVGVVG